MKKIFSVVAFFVILSCEEVVIIDLPPELNLLVFEGSVSDRLEVQSIRLTRSNSFSGQLNPAVEDATVSVEDRNGDVYPFNHDGNGVYLSDVPFQGIRNMEYRANVVLSDGDIVQSGWSDIPPNTNIVLLSVDSFEENDPLLSGNLTLFFPRITARDSADYPNYYRWVFFKNGEKVTDPESITIQNDLFFDGNFIPNSFSQFEYNEGEEITVELQAINQNTFDFLALLKAQITTLGSSASTTPANVTGNLTNTTRPSIPVLGHFSTISISSASAIAEN